MNVNTTVVEGLVPFVHVHDITRSIAFTSASVLRYETPTTSTVDACGVGWKRNQARLMLADAEAPVPAAQQFVLFYIYAHVVEDLHERLAQAGLHPAPSSPARPALTASSASTTLTATTSW